MEVTQQLNILDSASPKLHQGSSNALAELNTKDEAEERSRQNSVGGFITYTVIDDRHQRITADQSVNIANNSDSTIPDDDNQDLNYDNQDLNYE